jgi:hypothetical protein
VGVGPEGEGCAVGLRLARRRCAGHKTASRRLLMHVIHLKELSRVHCTRGYETTTTGNNNNNNNNNNNKPTTNTTTTRWRQRPDRCRRGVALRAREVFLDWRPPWQPFLAISRSPFFMPG